MKGKINVGYNTLEKKYPYTITFIFEDGKHITLDLSEIDFMTWLHAANTTFFESKNVKINK